MQYYHKFILFYRYSGDQVTRAFQFNSWQQYHNCVDLGAIVLDVFHANGYSRSLCSKVNMHPADISPAHYRMMVEEHTPGRLMTARPDIS